MNSILATLSNLLAPNPPLPPSVPDPNNASQENSAPQSRDMVVIDYADLLAAKTSPNSLVSSKIIAAYGYLGLGILAISNVPHLTPSRSTLLPLAQQFAGLPEEVKVLTETPHAFYQVGWSYGNEKLQVRDRASGSVCVAVTVCRSSHSLPAL